MNQYINEIMCLSKIALTMKDYPTSVIVIVIFFLTACTNPDIKIQEKCGKKINNMMVAGTTVIFVANSLEQVKQICNRCILLEKGEIKAIGDTLEVLC